MKQHHHSLTLPAYVDGLQQTGRYTFSRKEALEVTKLSPIALQHAARRLAQQGRLVSPRRGFYVIVPLEYKRSGAPPPSWFIDQLMVSKAIPITLVYYPQLHFTAPRTNNHKNFRSWCTYNSAQLQSDVHTSDFYTRKR